ncbi:hypothetical protein N0V82_008781 [Gnomoniopsis sp. IMI 355080]|nr:hypothetical protein N0V82_008781 [Gnomoniopsis sp. IMI 355080]
MVGLGKRQTDLSASGFGYLAAGGNTSSCALASEYMVGSGELMDADTGVLVSANADLQPVALNNPVVGSITTDFEIVNGILVWSNAAFYNGQAVFCLLNDILYATFTAAGPPAGCTTVDVVVVQDVGVSASVSAGVSASLPAGVSASPPAGVSASLPAGVSASVPGISIPPPVSSVPATQIVPGISSSSGVAPSTPTASLTLEVGESINVDLGTLFSLLGTVASFTTTPAVDWITLPNPSNNILSINVPATWTPGVNVNVVFTVNVAGSLVLTYDLFLVIVGPSAPVSATVPPTSIPAVGSASVPVTLPSASIPAVGSASVPVTLPSASIPIVGSATSIAPITTSTPIVINVVQGEYYEIDLVDYLANALDIPQPPLTVPTDLSFVGLFDLTDAVTGALFYDIHGTVPADYPLGNIIVNVPVIGQGQASVSYTLNFVLVVTQQTISSSASLTGPTPAPASSTALVPTPTPVVFTLEQGQTFDIDLTPLINQVGDVVQSLLTDPVVDWISVALGGSDLADLVGTVPTDYPLGNVDVTLTVLGSGGITYKSPLVLTIVAGPPPVTIPSLTIPAASTSSAPATTTSIPSPVTTTVTVYVGQSFDIDLTALFTSSTDVVIDLGTAPNVDWITVGTDAFTLVGTVPADLDLSEVSEVTAYELVSTTSGDIYSIIVTFNIAPVSSSSSGVPSATPIPSGPTTPPPILPSSTLPSAPSTSSTAVTSFSTDINLVPGEDFDVDLSQTSEIFGALSLVLGSFSVTPVVDWITAPILEADGDYHLVGTVPTDALPGTVVVFIQGLDASGATLNIFANLVISQSIASSSSVGLATTPVGVSTSTSAISIPSLTPFVITLPVVAGQPFSIDAADVIQGALGNGVVSFLDAPVTPTFVTISTTTNDLIFSGTAPSTVLPGIPVISFSILDSIGATVLINIDLIILPATTPFVITVPVDAGQPFTIDAADVIQDATGNSVVSILDTPVTPDFVTTTTLGNDVVFSGTAPSIALPDIPVISFSILDSTSATVLINIDLNILPTTSSSSLPTSSPAVPTPFSSSASQTVSSPASSTSAADIPVLTLGSLVPGQDFFYDASTIVSDLTGGDTVTDLEAPLNQDFININQIPGTKLGDETISGTVPETQALGTYIITATAQTPAGNRVFFSLAIIIAAPTSSSSIASPSSVSLTGEPLPSSSATPTQSSTASTTTTTPFATILYLAPGQSFTLDAALLVEANGYLSIDNLNFIPVDATSFISLSGAVGAQVLSGTIPDDYLPGNTIIVDLLSLGSDTGDTLFNVLVEIIIIPGGTSSSVAVSSTIPAVPSSSIDSVSSFPSPGGSFSTSAAPETSSFATPEASSSAAIPGASSSATPESSSLSTPGGIPSTTPESSSSQEVPLPSTALASSTSASSQGPLPTQFEISPFQDFDLPLGQYLHSPGDIVTVPAGATGFTISGQDLIVSPAAGLAADAVASVTLNVGGSLGPYTLPFSFFVLPSSFTISADQTFTLDFVSYLQTTSDVPSLETTAIQGLVLNGDTLTIAPSVLALLAGTTFTTPIQVLGAAGLYTLPFSITVLPLPGSSSSTNLASQTLPSASASVTPSSTNLASQTVSSASASGTPSSSYALTATASSSTALASQSAAPFCQLTGTLAPVAVCNVPLLRYFSLALLPYVQAVAPGATVRSILSTTPSIAWLSLDVGSQLLAGIPPAGSPATVQVILQGVLGADLVPIQIELDIIGAQSTSSLAAPSTAVPSATTSRVVSQPTPTNCRPATDGLAVAICDVLQLQNFYLPLSAYIGTGSTVLSISQVLDVSLGVDTSALGVSSIGNVLTGVPPVTALGEYIVALVYLSAGNAVNTLNIEINVIGSQASSSQASLSTAARSTAPFSRSSLLPTSSVVLLPTPPPSSGSTATVARSTSSTSPVPTVTVQIPVIAGQLNIIDLSPYLEVPATVANTILGLVSSVPQVNYLSLVGTILSANVPAGSTGSVFVTVGARYGVVITYDLVLQLQITSPSSSASSSRAPTPTSSVRSSTSAAGGPTIITSSSTIYTTLTLASSTSSIVQSRSTAPAAPA